MVCNNYYSSYNCEIFYLIVIGIPALVVFLFLGGYFCYRRQQIEKHRPPANEFTPQHGAPAATVPTASMVHSQQYGLNGTDSYVVEDTGHFHVVDKASV